jgi:hypothetical protein
VLLLVKISKIFLFFFKKNFYIKNNFNEFFSLDITGHGLAKIIEEYLQSECTASAILSALENTEKILENSFNLYNNFLIIRARTARCWRDNLGFSNKISKEDIYIYGHKGQDIVDYQNNIFLKLWV